MKICPVILSGGSGTRLWPLSRSAYPKQFLDLSGEGSSLFMQTLDRCVDFKIDIQTPIVVSNEEHRFIIAQQVRESNIEKSDIILEPSGRNTAPAITLAAMHLERVVDEDCLMLIMPSDHTIQPQEDFLRSVNSSIEEAVLGSVCTFGILPTKPHTGYGYIEVDEGSDLFLGVNTVNSFREKPSLDDANRFIKQGNYFWNSGIYLLKQSVFLESMNEIAPEIISFCRKSMTKAIHDSDFIRPDPENFSNCPSISIDHALMEKIIDKGRSVKTSHLIAEWNDIGSLSSLLDVLPKDIDGNGIHGDVLSIGTKNSLLHSSDGLLTAIGLQDMLVVKTADAVLVAPKNKDQEIKEIVNNLKMLGREEAVFHNEVHRPWGTYEVLHESKDFKVKSLKIYPGSQLSLQMHNKRSEHWVVVEGTATVRLGEDTFNLEENESTFIPSNTKHSLANNTDSLLEIVEVQTGSYLGEDDIVRFEDQYGRVK